MPATVLEILQEDDGVYSNLYVGTNLLKVPQGLYRIRLSFHVPFLCDTKRHQHRLVSKDDFAKIGHFSLAAQINICNHRRRCQSCIAGNGGAIGLEKLAFHEIIFQISSHT